MLHECLAERDLGCSSPCSENTVRKTLQPLSDDDMTVCPLVTIGALVSLAALAGTVQGSKRPPQGPGPTATRLGRLAAGPTPGRRRSSRRLHRRTRTTAAADTAAATLGQAPRTQLPPQSPAAPHLTYPAGPHSPWPTQGPPILDRLPYQPAATATCHSRTRDGPPPLHGLLEAAGLLHTQPATWQTQLPSHVNQYAAHHASRPPGPTAAATAAHTEPTLQF